MLVVAVVAIIVVGPKDLPGMLRTVGKSVKKIRGMAGDFQRQFDDALKEAELDGVKKTFDDVKSMNPLNQVKDTLNPLKDIESELKEDLKDIEFDDDDEDDSGRADTQDYSGFDPEKLFDQSKSIEVAKPVKVDVKAALAREKAKTAKAAVAKKSKSTRKPAKAKTKEKPVKTAVAAKKQAASKSATKKTATKAAAAKKPAAKPRKSAPKKAKSA